MSTVKAQMPGVFYRRPSPDSDPYVQVGSHIDSGQTVGLIEATKTFNPVSVDHEGTIARFLLEEGSAVNAGQDLIELDDS